MQEKEPEVIVVQEGVPSKTIEVPAGSKVVVEKVITKDTPTEEASVKKLSLVDNWKKVLRTYSVWFHGLSLLLTFVEQILPYVGLLEPTMTTQTYAFLMFGLNALGVFSRFIKQNKLLQEVIHIPKDSQQEGEEGVK